MAFRIGNVTANSVRKQLCTAFVNSVNTGSIHANARLLIYTGTQPATPATAATGTLLVTVDFANPAFSTPDDNGLSGLAGSTLISGIVSTAGVAGWFRVVDRDDNALFDGSITATGGGGDMEFNDVNFIFHGEVRINAMAIQFPM